MALAPPTPAQLTADHNQFFSQEQDDITGGAERGNRFGRSVDAGDFNNDGFADLAIGMPGEDGGSVIVIYGSVDLLTSQGNQRFRQGKDGVPDNSESEDSFGLKVAAGDFNGDGFDDLAVGAPGGKRLSRCRFRHQRVGERPQRERVETLASGQRRHP